LNVMFDIFFIPSSSIFSSSLLNVMFDMILYQIMSNITVDSLSDASD
jgi:hypothetical protein